MFAWCSSGHFGHRALSETDPIGGARVQASHSAPLPSKNCFEFGDRSAVLGRARSTDLPDTVCRLSHTSRSAGVAKHVTERFLGERFARVAADERQLATGAGR